MRVVRDDADYCNRIFERAESQRRSWPKGTEWLRSVLRFLGRIALKIEGGWVWFWLLSVVRIGLATAAVLSWFSVTKVHAAWLLGALTFAELIPVAAKAARRDELLDEALTRAQRFLEGIFYLLNDNSDFRVTLLMTYKDPKNGKTYLRPLLRNAPGSDVAQSRWLEIDTNKGSYDGVAGMAWRDSTNMAKSAPRSADGSVDSSSREYRDAMGVLSSSMESRPASYVLAGTLRHESEHHSGKIGVVCVDARVAANVLGSSERLEDLEKTTRPSNNEVELKARLQQMEASVFIAIDYFARRVLRKLVEACR